MYGPKGDEGARGFKGATGPPGLQVQHMTHTFVFSELNKYKLKKMLINVYKKSKKTQKNDDVMKYFVTRLLF